MHHSIYSHHRLTRGDEFPMIEPDAGGFGSPDTLAANEGKSGGPISLHWNYPEVTDNFRLRHRTLLHEVPLQREPGGQPRIERVTLTTE